MNLLNTVVSAFNNLTGFELYYNWFNLLIMVYSVMTLVAFGVSKWYRNTWLGALFIFSNEETKEIFKMPKLMVGYILCIIVAYAIGYVTFLAFGWETTANVLMPAGFVLFGVISTLKIGVYNMVRPQNGFQLK